MDLNSKIKLSSLGKWVVLQEPNKIKEEYYVWQESTYSKKPNIGFLTKTQADIYCEILNKETKQKEVIVEGVNNDTCLCTEGRCLKYRGVNCKGWV